MHSSNVILKNASSRTATVSPESSLLPARTSNQSGGTSSETPHSHEPASRKGLEMERVNVRAAKASTTHTDGPTPQNSKVHKDHRHLCERREKLNQSKPMPHPVLHPDVALAQMEENTVIRFCEDSRPMFSPVPRNSSSDAEGEDSPRAVSSK